MTEPPYQYQPPEYTQNPQYVSPEQQRGYLPVSKYPGAPMPPVYGPPQTNPYAHWGLRVAAYILDALIGGLLIYPLLFVFTVATGTPFSATTDQGIQIRPYDGTGLIEGWGVFPDSFQYLSLVAYAASFVFGFWNQVWRQGRTGSSLGKSAVRIKVVSESTGQPIGAGMMFLRALCHILDALPCYVGFLWPLWDQKRQTFADKIMSTVVVPLPPKQP
jgi:uncharacterized RDD family membrane protein YckC